MHERRDELVDLPGERFELRRGHRDARVGDAAHPPPARLEGRLGLAEPRAHLTLRHPPPGGTAGPGVRIVARLEADSAGDRFPPALPAVAGDLARVGVD